MTRRVLLCTICLIVACWGGLALGTALAADAVTLRFQPTAETITLQELLAKVDNVSLEGNPLGIDGTISAKVKHTTKPVDPEKQTLPVALELTEISQLFQGQEVAGNSQAKVAVDISPTGLIDAQQYANQKLFTTAGIPVELLALLCHTVRFPDDPVAVGQEWEITDDVRLTEDDQPIPITATTKLFKIDEEGNAWLLSQISAQMPDFSAPNPMGYGPPVKVTNGTLHITDLWRVFSIASSVVTKAQGKTKFSGQIDMQGYPLKGEMTAGFELKAAPVKAADASAATTATNQ